MPMKNVSRVGDDIEPVGEADPERALALAKHEEGLTQSQDKNKRARDERTVRELRAKLFSIHDQNAKVKEYFPDEAKGSETVKEMRHRLFKLEPQDGPYSRAKDAEWTKKDPGQYDHSSGAKVVSTGNNTWAGYRSNGVQRGKMTLEEAKKFAAKATDVLPVPIKTSSLVPLPAGERNEESYVGVSQDKTKRARDERAKDAVRFEATVKMPVRYQVVGSQKEETAIVPVEVEGYDGKVGGVMIPRTSVMTKFTGKNVGTVWAPNMNEAQKAYERGGKAKDAEILPVPIKTSSLVPLPSGERNEVSYASDLADLADKEDPHVFNASRKDPMVCAKCGGRKFDAVHAVAKKIGAAALDTAPAEEIAELDAKKKAGKITNVEWARLQMLKQESGKAKDFKARDRGRFAKMRDANADAFNEGQTVLYGGRPCIVIHMYSDTVDLKTQDGYKLLGVKMSKLKSHVRATDMRITLPLQRSGSEPADHLFRATQYEIGGDRARALDSYRAAAGGYRRAGDQAGEQKAKDGIMFCQSAFDTQYDHPGIGRVRVCDSADIALRTALERTRAGEAVHVDGRTVRPGRARANDATWHVVKDRRSLGEFKSEGEAKAAAAKTPGAKVAEIRVPSRGPDETHEFEPGGRGGTCANCERPKGWAGHSFTSPQSKWVHDDTGGPPPVDNPATPAVPDPVPTDDGAFSKLERQWEARGESKKEAGGVAYKVGSEKYGKAGMAKKATEGRSKDHSMKRAKARDKREVLPV